MQPTPTSPKAVPPFASVSSRNPRLMLLAAAGIAVLVLVALVGIVTGLRHRATETEVSDATAELPATPPLNALSGPASSSLPPAPSSAVLSSPPSTGLTTSSIPASSSPPPSSPTQSALSSAGSHNPSSAPRTASPSAVLPPTATPTPIVRNLLDEPPPTNPGSPSRTFPAAAPEAARPTSTGVPATSAVPPTTTSYVVQPNDTLWSIAQRHLGNGARWPEIVKANPGLDAARLRPGMKLRLPSSATAAAATLAPSSPPTSSTSARTLSHSTAPRTVVVREGDTLYAIARREYGNGELWDLIYNANKNKLRDPHVLPVGLTLLIPPRPQG